jgi:ribosome-associated protein
LATRKTTTDNTTSGTRKSTSAKGGEGKRRSSARVDSRVLALEVANAALEHKALKVEIIDVRGKVDYSDYVVIMSGRSDRQVAALARNIEGTLNEHGQRCIGVEGLPHAAWLLMDYGDVIVHIFHEDTRGYYDLETLWIDAARVSMD